MMGESASVSQWFFRMNQALLSFGIKSLGMNPSPHQDMSNIPPWIMDASGRMIYTISGDDPWEPQLTPGADLAKRRGCTCSRLDNKWGAGIRTVDEETGLDDGIEFLITPHCPLHDNRDETNQPANR